MAVEQSSTSVQEVKDLSQTIMIVEAAVRQFLMGKLPGVRPSIVRNHLALSQQLPFVDDQAVEADGAAGVDLVRADADFGGRCPYRLPCAPDRTRRDHEPPVPVVCRSRGRTPVSRR
jgi:hypothetical protein